MREKISKLKVIIFTVSRTVVTQNYHDILCHVADRCNTDLKLFSIQKGNSFVGNVIRAEGLNIVLLKAKNTGKRKLVTRKENMKAIIPKGSVQNITEKIDSPIQFGGGI